MPTPVEVRAGLQNALQLDLIGPAGSLGNHEEVLTQTPSHWYLTGCPVPTLPRTQGLWRMVQFAEVFPDDQIVAALSRQLSWSHFVELIPIEDRLKREFYVEVCRVERWSVRSLLDKIGHVMHEAAMACFSEVDSELLDCRLPVTCQCKQRLTAKDVVERLFGPSNQPRE